MKVECEGPVEFTSAMISSLMGRRGIILGQTEEEGYSRVEAEAPLAEMFGYSTALRSATQGKAEFTMEFAKYSKAPDAVSTELIAEYQAEREAKKK
jgi:elongation factor G